MSSSYRVQPQPLMEITSLILNHHGISNEDAQTVAKSLVEADLRGVSSHGVIRLSIYLKRLQSEVMKREPHIRIVAETDSTAVIDGDYGMGQVVSQKAIDILLEKTTKSNVAAVTIRHSNHFGAGAYWAMQMLEHGMIGVAVSNVEPLMVTPGGAAARVGNNPLSIAVPAGIEKPIVLDMATSVVPLGRIVAAKSKGESIPEGWAVDASGQPTTDPDVVINGGNLFPVGGPKGYGLAVIIDILSAVLSGGAVGQEIGSLYQNLNKPNDISHFFLALRVDAFMNPQIFQSSVDRYIQYMKDTPLAAGAQQIYLPGEIEFLNKERNAREGILLPAAVVEEICQFAEQAGISSSLIHLIKLNPQN